MLSKIVESTKAVLDYLSYDEESHYFADIDFNNPTWYEDSLVCKLTGEYRHAHIYIHMLMLVFNDEKKVEEFIRYKALNYINECCKCNKSICKDDMVKIEDDNNNDIYVCEECANDNDYFICNDCKEVKYHEYISFLNETTYCFPCASQFDEDKTDEEDDA
jgi:formylmethanofuran dehydrogenase subunit E